MGIDDENKLEEIQDRLRTYRREKVRVERQYRKTMGEYDRQLKELVPVAENPFIGESNKIHFADFDESFRYSADDNDSNECSLDDLENSKAFTPPRRHPTPGTPDQKTKAWLEQDIKQCDAFFDDPVKTQVLQTPTKLRNSDANLHKKCQKAIEQAWKNIRQRAIQMKWSPPQPRREIQSPGLSPMKWRLSTGSIGSVDDEGETLMTSSMHGALSDTLESISFLETSHVVSP